MFENRDSIETDVHRPEQCPVTDRELAEASPTPLIRRWAERRLVGASDAGVLPSGLTPREWPRREPGEPVALYLGRVPAPDERTLSTWRSMNDDVPVDLDPCPVSTGELSCVAGSPLADALLQARHEVRPDRSALTPRYCGEDWPVRSPGEPAGEYLGRAARLMLGAIYVRAEAGRIPEGDEAALPGEPIN